MTLTEFQNIEQELLSFSDQRRQAELAQFYSRQNGFDRPISENTIASQLLYRPSETTREDLMFLKVRDYTIPYVSDHKRPFFIQRLLYFSGSAIFEEYINSNRNNAEFSFSFRGETVGGPRYTRGSGNHTELAMGCGTNVPDFYLWLESKRAAVMVEFKFVSELSPHNSVVAAKAYYEAHPEPLHRAKVLLVFIERDKKFYMIDYVLDKIIELAWPCPEHYISSADIMMAKNYWQNDTRLKEIQYGNYK